MAAGTGLSSTIESAVMTYLTGGAVPSALASSTIYMRLITIAADATNNGAGTECADTSYTGAPGSAHGQPVTWNAPAQTAGNGAANGFYSATNSGAITFPAGAGSTGFAAQFVIHGYELWAGNTGTPTRLAYQNLGSNVTIPIGQQAVAAATTGVTLQVG